MGGQFVKPLMDVTDWSKDIGKKNLAKDQTASGFPPCLSGISDPLEVATWEGMGEYKQKEAHQFDTTDQYLLWCYPHWDDQISVNPLKTYFFTFIQSQ